MAEAYGLWQGLKQLEARGIEEAIMFGDSRIIIQAINGENQGHRLRLVRMIEIMISLSKIFMHLEFSDILRKLNDKADLAANKAIALHQNELCVNLLPYNVIPP